MPGKTTRLALEGNGPWTLPPLDRITVAMGESGSCIITGRLPMAGDRIQRYVDIPISTATAMQLLGLLQAFQTHYDLPMPTKPVQTRGLQ